MYTPVAQAIPLISLPNAIDEQLKRLTELLASKIEKDGINPNKGGIHLDNLESDLEFVSFLHKWVHEFNDVIENINIILNDLNHLPEKYKALPGSPEKRFHVLLRSFFHEFYRFREILGIFLSLAAKNGHIEKEGVKPIKDEFHNSFKNIIDTRNKLVHGAPSWHGKDYVLLTMFSIAYAESLKLIPIDANNSENLDACLSRLCDDVTRKLATDSKSVSKALSQMFAFFVLFHKTKSGAV